MHLKTLFRKVQYGQVLSVVHSFAICRDGGDVYVTSSIVEVYSDAIPSCIVVDIVDIQQCLTSVPWNG